MANFGDVKSDQLQEYFYIPPSVIFPYGGTAAPTGFLFCDGSSYGTATYPTLFNTIGYTYGGSGTAFSIPDLRGRVGAGKDNMGGNGTANRLTTAGAGIAGTALGVAGGSETHSLGTAQLPAHAHTASGGITSINHSHTMDAVGNHSHTGSTGPDTTDHGHGLAGNFISTQGVLLATLALGSGRQLFTQAQTQGINANHSHGLNVDGGGGHTPVAQSTDVPHSHSVTVNNAGGNAAHNNTQPTIILHYIIKY
jgi:microcystin-dependent protein